PRRCSKASCCCSSGSVTRTWPRSGATRSTPRCRRQQPTSGASRSWSEVAPLSDAGDTSTSDTGTEEPQALPGDGLREGVVDALRAAIGDQLVDTHLLPQTDLWVRVAPEAWARTAEALKAQGFDYFCFLSAIDWMPSPYGKGED